MTNAKLDSHNLDQSQVLIPLFHHSGIENRDTAWEFPTEEHRGQIPHMEYHTAERRYYRSIPYHSLLIVVKGSVEYTLLNQAPYLAKENRVIHLQPHQLHHIRSVDTPMSYAWVHYRMLIPPQPQSLIPLNPAEEERLLLQPMTMQECVVDLPTMSTQHDPELVKKLLNRIINEHNQETPGWQVLARAYLIQLLTHIFRSGMPNSDRISPQVDDPDISKALEFIGHHYASKLSIEQLSRLVHLSPNYFIMKFKKTTGLSPLDYVHRVRVDQAKRLIRSKQYSLTDIAFATGFESVSYFSRIFKKIERISPNEFKHSLY